MHRLTSLGLTLIASAAIVGPAYAADSAVNAYGGGGQVPGTVVAGVEQSQAPSPQGAGPSQSPTVAGATATRPASSAAPGTAAAQVATATPTQTVGSGSLPFTGFDLVLITLGGVALVGLGLAMRRLTHPAAG